MKLISILTTLTLTLTHTAFSQTNTSTEKANIVRNAYQVQYPKTWKVDSSRTMGADLFIFSPLENATDKFRENVNIIIQDLKGQNIDLEKYKQISDKQFAELKENIQVFESTVTKLNGKQCYKAMYRLTQGGFKLKVASICYIKDEKAYLTTFTSEIDKYEQYKKAGEEILASFTLAK
jgi:hypothetical protein